MEKAYDILKARHRTKYFSDKSERDLWVYNTKLKEEIDRSSFSGYSEADIDIVLSTIWESESIATELLQLYSDEGYVVKIKNLIDRDGKVGGFNFSIYW